jgi:hypothetical protein
MKFDKLETARCEPLAPENEGVECPVIPPPPICADLDVCCADPVFAQTFPELCVGRGIYSLRLKPAFVSKEVLQTVQYRTFLVGSTGEEVELTQGLTYGISDSLIGVIGAASGSLTTLAEGIATVSVSWEQLSAYAQLNVVAECAVSQVGMVELVDDSRSMSQAFGGAYATRLTFAKALGRRFITEVNVTKDEVGVGMFSTSGSVIQELTIDLEAAKTKLASVPSTQNRTDLAIGLRTVIDYLNNQALGRRVIILFSDGESNQGDDSVVVANEFKESGGIILVVGCRASGAGFIRLGKIASAGFFLNGYPGNEAATADLLSGLKGYFCAGNCNPLGDRYVPTGALDYTGFKNWDVQGKVDLIGPGLFDLVPGHGMYVDLAGSSDPWLGRITTKQSFTFALGVQYRVSLQMAGNQRTDAAGFKSGVQIGTMVGQEITINDYKQPFTAYTYLFVGDGTTQRLAIEQKIVPTGPLFAGNLLDEVKIEKVSTSEVLFHDDFDQENLQYVQPCGAAPADPPAAGEERININAHWADWLTGNIDQTFYARVMALGFGGVTIAGENVGTLWRSNSLIAGPWVAGVGASTGKIWTTICATPSMSVIVATYTEGSVGSTGDLKVNVSLDGGLNWAQRSVALGAYWTGSAISSSGGAIYLTAFDAGGGPNGGVYKSTDSGATFNKLVSAGDSAFLGVACSTNGSVIAAVTGAGGLLISTNGGTSWTPNVVTGAGVLAGAVAMNDSPGTLIVSDFNNLFKSTDNGGSWTKLEGPGLRGLEGVGVTYWGKISISTNGLIIVVNTAGFGLFYSVDGGLNWKNVMRNRSVNSAMRPDGAYVVIADNGKLKINGTRVLDPAFQKKGPAAVGAAEDYWNEFCGEILAEGDIPVDWLAFSDGRTLTSYFSGRPPPIVLSEMVGGYDWSSEQRDSQPDAMVKVWLQSASINPITDWKTCAQSGVYGVPANGCRFMRLTGLPEGNYNFYVYGHGSASTDNARFRLSVDLEYAVEKQTSEGSAFNGVFRDGTDYVTFEKVHVGPTSTVYLFLLPPIGNSAGHDYNVWNGLQIERTIDPAPTWDCYGYGYGCLNSPPPEQQPDPNPLPDVESVL